MVVVLGEVEFASAIGIARYTQILGIPDITAEPKLVVASHLGPVVNELELLFTLNEGAVAPRYVEAIAHGECT
jgi:hypothetical protein